MTSVKGLAIIALLVGGTSLTMAQGGDVYSPGSAKHHNQPMVTAPARHDTKHHFPMYLSAKSHKGSKMSPTNN